MRWSPRALPEDRGASAAAAAEAQRPVADSAELKFADQIYGRGPDGEPNTEGIAPCA